MFGNNKHIIYIYKNNLPKIANLMLYSKDYNCSDDNNFPILKYINYYYFQNYILNIINIVNFDLCIQLNSNELYLKLFLQLKRS